MEKSSTKNRDDINKIKDVMIKHNSDNVKSFGGITDKIDHINIAIEDTKMDKERTHKAMREDYRQLREDIQALSDKVSPVVQWFDNISFGKRALMWILGLVGSLVAIALGIRNLFSH